MDLDAGGVVWCVSGAVRGVTSTLELTDELSDPPVHETTVDTLTLRAGTWRDPALPDTIPWPQPSGIWAAAWVLGLDAAFVLLDGSHVSSVYGITAELRNEVSVPSDAP